MVEVGIATGQAAIPFLKNGCGIKAIELGKDLAEYSKEKFKEYKNFSVYKTSFEDFECNDNSIILKPINYLEYCIKTLLYDFI